MKTAIFNFPEIGLNRIPAYAKDTRYLFFAFALLM